VTASLCKLMARGGQRELCFCVPAIPDDQANSVPRLAAPKALAQTARTYKGAVTIEALPALDGDKNRRPWHAKMLALIADRYTALMIGSSNFTCAGMGVGPHRNAEANHLTVVDRVDYGREAGQLEGVWPAMEAVDPESAEWLGARSDREEEEQAQAPWLPAGFLSATYRAGGTRQVVLRLDPDHLPAEWQVHAVGGESSELLSASVWRQSGRLSTVEIPWMPSQPPEKLVVQWEDCRAFLPLNVEDSRQLPPPEKLDSMSADDMLGILAATDPSAAFRAWAKQQRPSDLFDTDLDSATPIDLDPLQRYDLQVTFLHRIRRRARMLAQMRSNLQRPVWGRQALEWRLRGLVGIEPLANRLLRDLEQPGRSPDEALLTLADFLIVLSEVRYQPGEGSLSKAEFDRVFRPFLTEMADALGRQIEPHRGRVPAESMQFWQRVAEQCRG
jgi:hypothetical protein